MNIKPKRANALVLVYQIGSLGDTVVSVPSYRAVRRHFGPDADIRVLHNAPRDSRAVPHQVLDGSGLINGSVTFEQFAGRSTLKTWIALWSKLRTLKADAIVYVAPGERSPSSVRRDRFFFRLCGIPILLGFHAVDPACFHAKDAAGRPASVTHEAHLRLERLRRDGLPVDLQADFVIPLLNLPAEEQEKANRWLLEQCVLPQTLVAICPGANQPANYWPYERFLEIGNCLWKQHGIVPLIIGGTAEQEIGKRLLNDWGFGVNAAGHFSILGSAALISRCRLLVGLDTGTTHLAAALGIPCVGIYGERNPPGQWTPLGEGNILLRNPVPCSGCRLKECPIPDHPCMTGIRVDEVWAAVQEILGRMS